MKRVLCKQLVAPLDENLAPAMFAQRPPQIRRRARDDDTAFVELRQRVAQGAASGAAGRRASQGVMVAPVDRRLAAREGEPDQRIEQIMPVAGTRGDRALAVSTLLVALVVRNGPDNSPARSGTSRSPAV
jgi:hypothetical protein